MTIVDPPAKHLDVRPDALSSPPTFQDSAADPLLSESFAPPGGEAPPTFTPYDASYFTSSDGSIISHDPHLNEDGTLV